MTRTSKRDTSGYKREHGLTLKQQNALDLLVQGKNDAATAEAIGANRVTVTRWRNYDPYFQAELNRRRKATWGVSIDRLRSLLPCALDALEQELKTGKHQARTALEILRLAGLDRNGSKASLETYGVGLTDANAIVDAHARSRRPNPYADVLDGEPVTERERQSVRDELAGRLMAE